MHINGEAVKRERVDDFFEVDVRGHGNPVERYRETLPNGVTYTTLDYTQNGFHDDTQVYEVPPDHFFMMGDNRDNSQDSRVLNLVGFVPFENFVGRAEIIFFSVDEFSSAWQVWKWPWSVRWRRLFNLL